MLAFTVALADQANRLGPFDACSLGGPRNTESQRAAIEQIPDVTFLPFSSAQPTAIYVLLLRDMLVNR